MGRVWESVFEDVGECVWECDSVWECMSCECEYSCAQIYMCVRVNVRETGVWEYVFVREYMCENLCVYMCVWKCVNVWASESERERERGRSVWAGGRCPERKKRETGELYLCSDLPMLPGDFVHLWDSQVAHMHCGLLHTKYTWDTLRVAQHLLKRYYTKNLAEEMAIHVRALIQGRELYQKRVQTVLWNFLCT